MSDEIKSTYEVLLGKLDEFTRKYYKNQLIRGGLYATGMILLFFLSVALLEYFGRFETGMRTFLFWSFLLGTGFIIGRWVMIPLFKLYRIGKIISHEQAADIIGKHFTNVQDKLLNVLQLQQAAHETNSSGTSEALLEASINQKISELRPVPFTAAIDLKQNRRYAKYALAPLLTLIVILFVNAGIITDSTDRLVHHGTYYEMPAPFQFIIRNADLKTIEQQDFPLQIKLSGKEIPESVSILFDGEEHRLTRENTINFNYTFRNVQKNKKFRLTAAGYTSREYELQVMPNPIVLNFGISLKYPKYLNRKDETLTNTGDLIVPAGTMITWNFATKSTKDLKLRFNDTLVNLKAAGDNRFAYSARPMTSKTYSVHTANEFIQSKDSILYSINVIPDNFPGIQVDERKDSVTTQRLYFRGQVKDDYGFTKLTFNYDYLVRDTTGNANAALADPGAAPATPVGKVQSVDVSINNALTQNQFYHAWDMTKLGIRPGDQIEYYFEVWDNDGVNGPKSSRSQRQIFRAPTRSELSDKSDKANDKIKEDMEASIDDAKKLEKDVNDMYKKVMEKKSLSWEDKKKVEDLIQQQKELQKNVDNIKQQNEKNVNQQQEYNQDNQALLDKQEQVQQLFDQLMNDDMKKQLEQLEKLLDNLNKNQLQDQLDQMKLNAKDMEKELDRTLQLFKQMELEQKLTESIQRLEEMSKKQDELSKQSEEKSSDSKQIDQKQQDLNKEFQDLRQDLDKIEEMNKQLEEPNNIQNTDVQEMQIQQQQQQSSQSLQDNKKKDASKSQKNASQQMQQLSQQLQDMQNQMQQEQQSEDMNTLREILENLVQLSFDQEKLMNTLGNTSVNDPQYVNIAREQAKLKDDSKQIEDSLLALSKRNPQISSVVNKSITSIHDNMDKTVGQLAERQSGMGQMYQQRAMTSINDLALILNESLEQMMQQMNSQNKIPGSGSCNKPGGKGKSKPSMSSLRSMQQQINQKIGELQKGQQGQNGQQGMSKELAKLAAQQEYIRNMLQKAMQEGEGKDGKDKKKPGSGAGGDLPQKMEDTETDLVNKRITAETVKRQQDILNKLLEFEKAERERDQDTKRESNEAKNQNTSNPDGFLEYKRQKQKEVEMLKTVPPTLSPFYKNKVNDYFNDVEKK